MRLIVLLLASLAGAAPYADDLCRLGPTWQVAGDWLVPGAGWSAGASGLTGRAGDAILTAVPAADVGSVAVTLTPVRRVDTGGWVVAGLRLVEDPDRYWQLALVEDPDQRTRRCELVEMLDGHWQAQNLGASKLTLTTAGQAIWHWATAYRLELSWSATTLTGRLKPAGGVDWQWRVEVALPPGTPAVRAGRPVLRAAGIETTFRDLRAETGHAGGQRATGKGAVLLDGEGSWTALPRWRDGVAALRALATEAGYPVRVVSPGDLAGGLDPTRDGLLLAPSLERLPLPAIDALAAFVRSGGDLLATGGEPFAQALHRTPDGRWQTEAEALANVQPTATALNPSVRVELARACNEATPAHSLRFGAPGPQGRADALELVVEDLSGWLTLQTTRFAASPFGAERELTIVWVKGTPGQSTTVEWKEEDGSRWIATVPLSAEWRKHVLGARDFQFWRDGSPPERDGTSFRPAHASVLSFGPALGFGARKGRVELGLGPVGLARAPMVFGQPAPPRLETISPWYKQYVTNRGSGLVRVPHSRPRGLALAPEPDGRFTAIGSVLAPEASRHLMPSGAVLWWLVRPDLPAQRRAELVALLRRTRLGVGLICAGPRDVTAWTGERVECGARLLNAGVEAAAVTVSWTITRDDKLVRTRRASLTLAPGAARGVLAPDAADLPPGEYRVTTVASLAGEAVDEVRGWLRVVDPAALRRTDRRVAVRGDRFVVGGKPVFLNGVNYWPRNVSGLEPSRFHSGWLLPHNYDPEVVEADLATMARLGLNLVSIQYANPQLARPLVDFLERCRHHRIWANLYTGSAGGLQGDPARDRALLEGARLPGNDTVAMYDLHWEPRLGAQADRRRWDGAWRDWLREQYGALERAEQAWGVAAPRDGGELSNPTDDQFATDGPHRVMVAAYRRFADDLISRAYGRVSRSLRRLDPETLLGVRTGYGGTGQAWPARVMAYDLTSGAAHLDFTSPEGYGMPGEWDKARRTGFITAYGKWAGHGKPVFWSEFGASIGAGGGTQASRAAQTLIWDSTLRLCADSGVAAAAGWWWPGGWRVDERSDFGVLEPDGTPREALLNAADWGKRIQAGLPPDRGTPLALCIDRDADARGLLGLWSRHDQEYVAARQAGRPVTVGTVASGTTTRTMPVETIGQGGPLKHANAEVTGLRALWPGGEARVENGVAIKAPAGAPVRIEVTLLNTGEAAWEACALQLGTERVPLPGVVPRFGRATVALTARSPATLTGRVVTAAGTAFGERVKVVVE